MTNSTQQSQQTVNNVSKSKKQSDNSANNRHKVMLISEEFGPNADTIFFIRLFARACQTTCWFYRITEKHRFWKKINLQNGWRLTTSPKDSARLWKSLALSLLYWKGSVALQHPCCSLLFLETAGNRIPSSFYSTMRRKQAISIMIFCR